MKHKQECKNIKMQIGISWMLESLLWLIKCYSYHHKHFTLLSGCNANQDDDIFCNVEIVAKLESWQLECWNRCQAGKIEKTKKREEGRAYFLHSSPLKDFHQEASFAFWTGSALKLLISTTLFSRFSVKLFVSKEKTFVVARQVGITNVAGGTYGLMHLIYKETVGALCEHTSYLSQPSQPLVV